MTNLTEESKVLSRNNKMFKAESISIEVVNTTKSYAEIRIFVKNKWGKFQLFPNMGTHNVYTSRGSAITIMAGKNFKLKTRLKIE